MRRLLLFFVALLVVAIPAQASATADTSSSGTGSTATTVPVAADPTATTVDNGFLDSERDLTECVSSIERPGCGNKGRGGALQLVTFGVLTLGIAFICWRVARGVKARDAALAAKTR